MQPIRSSPQELEKSDSSEEDDLDKDPDLPKPRLSLPLEVDEEDDSLLMPPPRLSVPLEDENLTTKSIEVPRRALSEQPLGRLSRGSLGSVRISDQFGDLSRLDTASEPTPDDSIMQRGAEADFDIDMAADDDALFDQG